MTVHICAHIIHAYPLSNLNRDDLGSPKIAVVGGVERSRVSSQSTKRQVRHKVEEILGDTALRTRRVPVRVAAVLCSRGWDGGEAEKAGQAVALAAGVKGLAITDEGLTSVMLYLPEAGIEALADIVEANRDAVARCAAHQEAVAAAEKDSKKTKPKLDAATTKEFKAIQGEVRRVLASRNASIAAFGRMLANTPEVSVDGAVSVAHAITTHATAEQADFFTAVDDIPGPDNGSAHMGNAAHTAGCFYEYASVNLSELLRNFQQDRDAVAAFLPAFLAQFARTVPQAKKNSTAPFTPAALVHYTVRTDQPISLADAFEAPITATNDSGYTAPSITAFNEHAAAVNTYLGTSDLVAAGYCGFGTKDGGLEALGAHTPALDDLVAAISTAALAAVEPQQ